MDLSHKTVIVTGASKGIGKAIALRFARQGSNVIGVYRSNDAAAKQIRESNQHILMIKGDAGNEKDVRKIINITLHKYSGIDFVINNAGIDLFGKIENYAADSWDRMMATNVKSVFLFSKYAIPHLKKSLNPVIINISSRIGFSEFSEPDFVAYGVTKAAVTYFTIALSKELQGTNIRVNAVIPTPTKTDLFDEVFTPAEEAGLRKKGKLGTPDEVAGLVMELISDTKANGKILIDKRVSL